MRGVFPGDLGGCFSVILLDQGVGWWLTLFTSGRWKEYSDERSGHFRLLYFNSTVPMVEGD